MTRSLITTKDGRAETCIAASNLYGLFFERFAPAGGERPPPGSYLARCIEIPKREGTAPDACNGRLGKLMSFRVAARTILELGSELISSDGIALYELIKNGLDAGSRRIRIDVQVETIRSDYEALLEEIDTNPAGVAGARIAILSSMRTGDVENARLQALLGASTTPEGLKSVLGAWYAERNFIRVSDSGHGMSVDDLQGVYLTVGTRSRLKERDRLGHGDAGRAPLGEKGVGRLSTMRLGDTLLVRTSRSGEAHFNELAIDWKLFDHSSDAMLDEIKLEPRRADAKPDPSSSGTQVVIGSLRTDWSERKLQDIAGEEFARLVDPWAERTAINILRLTFNGKLIEIPEIDPTFLKRSHGYCRATFAPQDGVPVLSGQIEYRLRGKDHSFKLNATELISVAKMPSLSAMRTLGPFDMEMWWFNRGLLNAKNGVPDSVELKSEIAKWAGGLMVFRDGYRVNPYGGPEDDWLELDKRAFSARGYKLNRQQVIGHVRISWKNRGLLDQTNREGLVATPERAMLIGLLRYVLLTEFKQFIEKQDDNVRAQERTTLATVGERVDVAESGIREKLSEIEQTLPKESRALARQATGLVDDLVRYVDEAKDLGDQYVQDRSQLVYLAGVGLMVEFVLHELDRATTGTLRTLRELDTKALSSSANAAVQTLAAQLETLNKRVSNLDFLSTARRQTKSSFSVLALVERTVSARRGEADRHAIALDGDFDGGSKDWTIKAVPGMLVQIVDNILANSFYWLKKQALVEHRFAGRISIEADTAARTITITDNGPGIDPVITDDIFQPFVTRKPAGEGRGLGLYISREVARSQGWSIDVMREETVRAGRYNSFVIDLSGKAGT